MKFHSLKQHYRYACLLLLALYLHFFFLQECNSKNFRLGKILAFSFSIFFFSTWKKRITKYKTLCSISRSQIIAAVKNGVKRIQAAAYNGARTVFWEGHKVLQNLYFRLEIHRTNLRWRFRINLWPSQNIWTLNKKNIYILHIGFNPFVILPR